MFPVMRFLATLLSTAALCSPVLAVCSRPQPRLVCAEYFKCEIVVEAKLVGIKHISEPGEPDAYSGTLYRMQTLKVLRGEAGESFNVYEENSSGRATFDWRPGRSYLLFLHHYWKKEGGWVIDGCGNSGPLSKAQAALTQIDQIPHQADGLIQVVIGGDWTSYSPSLPRVQVRAKNSEHTYSAKTNNSGVANLHVPAGEYTVNIPDGKPFQLFDFSYEDPRKVTIKNGGCAQIQFVAAQ